MTNKSKLLDIAERVEAAPGPCRELDAEICAALRIVPGSNADLNQWLVNWGGSFEPVTLGGELRIAAIHPDGKMGTHWKIPIHPTASIDAAASLMPEGRKLTSLIFKTNGKHKGEYEAWLSNGKPGQYILGYHNEPQLAVCAAALRAIAEGME